MVNTRGLHATFVSQFFSNGVANMVTTSKTTVTHLGITYSTTTLGQQPGRPLETCPDCQGSGELYTRRCRNCNGRGVVGGHAMSKLNAEKMRKP